MTRTALFALLAPLALTGCMMAGMASMAGMGHAGDSATHVESALRPDESAMSKEAVAHGLRVSAAFFLAPAGDAARVVVNVRRLDGSSPVADASVFLEVSPTAVGANTSHNDASHNRPREHELGATRAGHVSTRFAPVEQGDGQYVFQPPLARDGAYRLTVVVGGTSQVVLDPPIRFDHVMERSPRSSPIGLGQERPGARSTPLLLMLGGGLMTVMMLWTVR